ncbi:tRNA (N6-isopentenyl adenosine(37)-C2)-methylthiotransferase MiaB [Abyssibacter sp.]|jgi:tRNA-2-methylthio-N6-dimethylallyladenosine synthase|uniref:tRNA (N6-isopentenyl adenosine(37)-C2)-methylthiotransferase MiaB n=1 Tax=Abyssibacter sp. TaxID=2320200 RepID=UPI000C5CCDA5|nr:tRNA (N6-isopentenyl adenosine(37)-C2)-methylthiotransferase MiaB [Abyssibacter sp.]MBB86970.1 tRNA (N6-isopentenyl adenosine(37)-C2)-methylthiotransferase MiaB [Xanthomonadales bacterium]MCK5858407.1 tRNA (N6-isopentenyl adenosine(37)-C2)-methylthiotransferase MiaB [Abyssibacter sp.]
MSRGKLYIKTFGCQMNSYDSDKMADVLARSHQLERTHNPDDADVLLLNTCSVREKAQEKVFSELGRLRPLKDSNPNLLIGVGGCVASQEGDAIAERAPYVDLVFGPQTVHRLPGMVDQARAKRGTVVDISFPEIEKFDNLPEPRADGPTAFVSVMEGCSKYCTFCVVPYTRGEEISRPLDDVLTEVAQLAEQGVREITFLGQNVNAYRGAMADGATADLALLIHYTAQMPGVQRIRFTTSHPAEFTDDLITAYAEVPKLAGYLHLPVQAGSDRILAMMKRGHTAAEYLDKIARLRAARPDIALSTDIIVGFPTESDSDFAATMNVVHEAAFDHAFSFNYSPRPGTPAANLADTVPAEEKSKRLQILQTRVRQQGMRYAESLVGTTQQVLVERASVKSPNQMAGRAGNNRWVNFDGDRSLIGQMVDVVITEALPNSLRGRLVNASVAA